MNFLSLTFLAFFSITLLLYYLLPKGAQNALLLGANCVFYLWAGPAAGAYLLGVILLCWACALAMERWGRRRLWLSVGVVSLFAALFLFKYLDPATRAIFTLLDRTGPSPFEQFLPLGVSFYSFSLAGYLFDVYRGKCGVERNLLRFAAYTAFFPSVLSGPINRARELLPQLCQPRRFDLEGFKAGLWRFLCGVAKKLVPANILAELIDPAYAAPWDYGSGAWILVACAYSLYIYLDFSAYSDLAVGTAKMLGLTLPENFRAPYLSRSVKEFWKKWHISLTSWFREYLYFPLGGSRKGATRTCLNVLVVFAVSGLWHGAGLTFLIWGLLNGLYQVVGMWTLSVRKRVRAALHIPEDAWYAAAFQGLLTFGLITISWIFFRASSIYDALFILKRILLIVRDGPGLVRLPFPMLEQVVLYLSLALVLAEDVLITRGTSFRIQRTSFRFWITAALLASAALLFGLYGPDFQVQDFTYFNF